jgi:hypothetical protein
LRCKGLESNTRQLRQDSDDYTQPEVAMHRARGGSVNGDAERCAGHLSLRRCSNGTEGRNHTRRMDDIPKTAHGAEFT